MTDKIEFLDEDEFFSENGETSEDSTNLDEPDAVFDEHTDSVYDVEVSPNGRLVITGGKDETAFLWGLPQLPSEKTSAVALAGHTDTIVSVGFNRCGSLCYSASMDSTVNFV